MQRIYINLGRKKKTIGVIASASCPTGALQEVHLLVFAAPGTKDIRCYSLVHVCFPLGFLFHNLVCESKLAYRW